MVRAPARLAASRLTASMQPAFDATWGGADAMYAERLGAERAAELNRFAALAEAGVPLAFGSDAPVTQIDPWAAVRAAAYPRTPASAISPEAAFAAHTRGGWAAARRTDEGVLAPGAPATFAAWQVGELRDGLPDLTPGADLPSCVRTVLRGETIHPL
jgi:predicted amidohydrolase YtcJ